MISIREMKASDYQAISKIYQQGIDSSLCTFETCVPSWEDFNRTHLEKPRLVAVNENHQVCGFIILSPMSSRQCFRGVGEISIYLDYQYRGQGIGTLLMNEMIKESEECTFGVCFRAFFLKTRLVYHYINDVGFVKLVTVRS